MKALFLLFTLGGMIPVWAQALDARKDLLFPVNPPRQLAQSRATNSADSLGKSLIRKQLELEMLRRSGLGTGHPKVRSLMAQIDILSARMKQDTAAVDRHLREQEALVRQLVESLMAVQTRESERREAQDREIQKLRDEVAKLQDELKKAKGE
ncbi:MAG TPA: hypothetical protein PLS03_04505 [Terrimicrobiaceae bacterium]|nr:hypothetical protein [Terrimicrobiaceae bacterium]